MNNKTIPRSGGRAGLLAVLMLALALSLPAGALAAELPEVIPSGAAVGMRIQSEGAIVIDLVSEDGVGTSPAKEAGIRPGDRIVQIGSEKIVSAEDVVRSSKTLDGSPVTVRLASSAFPPEVTVHLTDADRRHTEIKLPPASANPDRLIEKQADFPEVP